MSRLASDWGFKLSLTHSGYRHSDCGFSYNRPDSERQDELTPKRLRVGAVSYLNTKPLVFGLEERSSQIELIFDLPSRLADGLAAGRYDVALIPSIEFFPRPWLLHCVECLHCLPWTGVERQAVESRSHVANSYAGVG